MELGQNSFKKYT